VGGPPSLVRSNFYVGEITKMAKLSELITRESLLIVVCYPFKSPAHACIQMYIHVVSKPVRCVVYF